MIDKSKYSSHGTFIKKMADSGLSKWNKTKLAIINPIPSTKTRQIKNNVTPNDIIICSQQIPSQHKFQQKVNQKPLPQELTQPFLYIQKVLKKSKVQSKIWKNLAPFMTSSQVKKRPANAINNKQSIPKGYSNLYNFQQDKKQTASKIFKKLSDIEVINLKDVYCMWNKKINLQSNPEINVKQQKFVQFMKELLHGKINQKLLKHFFQLYQNKNPLKLQKEKKQANNILMNQQNIAGTKVISIKALSFNYDKYIRAQNEVSNVMSEKAAKERYTWVKQYLTDFDECYSELKGSMNSIKNYQQCLRSHFKMMYNSYKNPFQGQIQDLKKQLQKPIIKYDKHKKDQLQNKIKEYQQENSNMHQRITEQYQRMIQSYEQTIVKNHDLFFAKRTICKLLLPILKQHPYVTKQLISSRIEQCQKEKERYLQCLSSLVVQMDQDKKHLAEDCFTLEEVVNLILMKDKKFYKNSQFNQEYMVASMKKLVKQIKKQFLIKNGFSIQNIEDFPADQQIPLNILHVCFQMQCTKVLLKNQIWNELLTLMPTSQNQSKFHRHTIACNECMEYLKKYFIKLDERSTVQRNRSKQVSLLIENANFQNMGLFAQVINQVSLKLSDPHHDNDQQQLADRVAPLQSKKKVGFADLAESIVQQENQQFYTKKQNLIQNHKKDQSQLVKSLLKSILDQPHGKNNFNLKQESKKQVLQSSKNQNSYKKKSDIPQSLTALKTLSKSFIAPQGLNTNSFDIRFYLKQNQKRQEQNIQEELLRLGTSQLLSNLPEPDKFQPLDPLKLSRFLSSNINKVVQQQKKVLHQKNYDFSVKEGVDNNYFRQKIKLQNRATRYDSQGKSKYSVLLPVGYYQSFIVNQGEQKEDKWYLRPHHVETLTENPLSKKDNLIHTEYQSKLEKIPLKKRPDEFIIQQNVKRKDELILSLQERINSLKQDILIRKVPSKIQGQPVSTNILNQYFSKITDGKQDKQLELAAYQGVLYDLRRKQKSLLVDYRQRQNFAHGQPQSKWWQKKDKSFNQQLRKDRILVSDSLKESSPHKQYVQKLKNHQIY